MGTGFEHMHRDHEELRTAVERLRMTAELAGTETTTGLFSLVGTDRRFLMNDLLPHAAGEEDVLYPAVRRVLGSDKSTMGMEHDHRYIELLTLEVGEIEAQLRAAVAVDPDGAVAAELANRVRRVFYSLYAVTLNHFEKEEGIYAPYLTAAMTKDEAQRLTDEIEAATAAHRTASVPMIAGG